MLRPRTSAAPAGRTDPAPEGRARVVDRDPPALLASGSAHPGGSREGRPMPARTAVASRSPDTSTNSPAAAPKSRSCRPPELSDRLPPQPGAATAHHAIRNHGAPGTGRAGIRRLGDGHLSSSRSASISACCVPISTPRKSAAGSRTPWPPSRSRAPHRRGRWPTTTSSARSPATAAASGWPGRGRWHW